MWIKEARKNKKNYFIQSDNRPLYKKMINDELEYEYKHNFLSFMFLIHFEVVIYTIH